MNRNWLQAWLLCAVVCSVLWFPSCGHEQKLVSITVTPQNLTITGAGLNVQYRATGNYSHPPEQKDLTQKVVWFSPFPQIMAFSDPTQPGLATSGFGCGSNLLITATIFSNPANPQAGTEVIGS